MVVRMICSTRSFATGKHHIFSKPILPEFAVFSLGFITIEYVGNEFLFPTILGNEFLFPRKRIFVSRKRKYGVDRLILYLHANSGRIGLVLPLLVSQYCINDGRTSKTVWRVFSEYNWREEVLPLLVTQQ